MILGNEAPTGILVSVGVYCLEMVNFNFLRNKIRLRTAGCGNWPAETRIISILCNRHKTDSNITSNVPFVSVARFDPLPLVEEPSQRI